MRPSVRAIRTLILCQFYTVTGLAIFYFLLFIATAPSAIFSYNFSEVRTELDKKLRADKEFVLGVYIWLSLTILCLIPW